MDVTAADGKFDLMLQERGSAPPVFHFSIHVFYTLNAACLLIGLHVKGGGVVKSQTRSGSGLSVTRRLV